MSTSLLALLVTEGMKNSWLSFTSKKLILALFLVISCLGLYFGQTADAKKLTAKTPEWKPTTPQNVNHDYTPVVLPKESILEGLILSKAAKLHQIDTNHFKMSDGCALIKADEPILIDGSKASVQSKPGTAFVVHSDETTTRVMNLSDRHRDSLRVIIDDYYITLNPGEEVALKYNGKLLVKLPGT